jgi:serine/threonine protein kinase
MGEVYRAEDTRLKRSVALKFLPPEMTRDDLANQRFLHEARAASALDHQNICAGHELSSNGVWSFNSPKEASREIGKISVDKMVTKAVKLILTWKAADK